MPESSRTRASSGSSRSRRALATHDSGQSQQATRLAWHVQQFRGSCDPQRSADALRGRPLQSSDRVLLCGRGLSPLGLGPVMTVHSRNDEDGACACWCGCACGALEGTQVDTSIPQRLHPCQVRRLLRTSDLDDKVTHSAEINLPTQKQAASAGGKLLHSWR